MVLQGGATYGQHGNGGGGCAAADHMYFHQQKVKKEGRVIGRLEDRNFITEIMWMTNKE